MGIRRRSFDRRSLGWGTRWHHFHREPPQDQDGVAGVGGFSLNGVSAGTTVPLAQSPMYLPPGVQLFFAQTDAGFTTVATYRIVGRDHFWRPITEDVTISAVAAGGAISPVTGFSLACYARVDSITITAITGAGAGDTIAVGIDPSTAASTGHNGPRVPIPWEVNGLSGITLVNGGSASGTSEVTITMSNFNSQYNTASVPISGSTTGRNLFFVFDPDVLQNV